MLQPDMMHLSWVETITVTQISNKSTKKALYCWRAGVSHLVLSFFQLVPRSSTRLKQPQFKLISNYDLRSSGPITALCYVLISFGSSHPNRLSWIISKGSGWTVNVSSAWWILAPEAQETRRCTDQRAQKEKHIVCWLMNKFPYGPDVIIVANDGIIEHKRDGMRSNLPQDTAYQFWWLLSFTFLTKKKTSSFYRVKTY